MPGKQKPQSWYDEGYLKKADSIAVLARQMGVDAAALEGTVKRFNGFVAKGKDEDFHRGEQKWNLVKRDPLKGGSAKNRALGSLQEPPYYGVRLSPSAFASGGVRVSSAAQVLNTRLKPVRGLYAVGNVAVHAEYGVGYQGGYSLASGMTFGYLCVKHMTRKRRKAS